MQSPLDYSQDGHVVTMTLNVPEVRNSLSGDDMIGALEEACRRLNGDMSVRAAILTGSGAVFSSGGNVKKMGQQATEDALPAQVRRRYKLGIQRIPLAFDKLEVPIIAAINGPAIGAGCDLACMCDIRIAAQSARFAESFVKLGIIPGDGGAWLLPRVVGYSKASEMTFTGDTITANEAFACGLVSKVVSDDELMTEARKLAMRISDNPPHAVRMAKRLIREGRHLQLASLLELSAAMQPLAQATADHIEAVAAFKEKRKPDFRGM